jgi:hypothetical protein
MLSGVHVIQQRSLVPQNLAEFAQNVFHKVSGTPIPLHSVV